MKLSKRWTSVTPLSKAIALALFIALPFIGYALGRMYQREIDSTFIIPRYQQLR